MLEEVRRLEDYLSLPHHPMADVSLENWCTILPSIEKIKIRCTNARMIVFVIRKLS